MSAEIALKMLTNSYTINETIAGQETLEDSIQATINQMLDLTFQAKLQGQLNSVVATEGCFHQSLASVLELEFVDVDANVLMQMATGYQALSPRQLSQPLSAEHGDCLQQIFYNKWKRR